jgi:hypothetical protein
MSLENDIYAFISTNNSVIAILGADPKPYGDGNSVWKGFIPTGQAVDPSIVLTCIATKDFVAAEGVLNGHTKRIRVDSRASSYTKAQAINDTVKNLLQNLKGTLGTTVVQAVIPILETDVGQEAVTGGYVFRRQWEAYWTYYELATPQPASPILPAPGNLDNAGYFQGVPVALTAPTDGQVLVFDAVLGEYRPETVSGTGASTNDGVF